MQRAGSKRALRQHSDHLMAQCSNISEIPLILPSFTLVDPRLCRGYCGHSNIGHTAYERQPSAFAYVNPSMTGHVLLSERKTCADLSLVDSITAAQLLPIAATIVASAVGSNIANVMPNPQLALGAIIASYVMWGMAVPMAFSVLVIYYQRLALHKMPPREVIVSAFLPLGPLGYGGYTVLNLGRAAVKVFPLTGSIDPIAGRIAYVMGFFVSLVMWGYGLIWFALALASIWKARPFPFNMGWWGCKHQILDIIVVLQY